MVQDPASEEAQLLRQYLATRDVPCLRCGYNLKGTPGHSCPECGADLRIRVQPWVRLPATYMLGVLGNVAGMGIAATAGVIGLSHSLPRVLLMGATFAVALALQLVWDPLHRRTLRRRRESVWPLVALTWIAPAGAVAALVVWLSRL